MNTQELHQYLESRGFKQWHTGGGCMAYGQDYDDEGKFYVLVTDAEDADLPETQEAITIGLYHENGEPTDEYFTGKLGDVMYWYEWTAREIVGDLIDKQLEEEENERTNYGGRMTGIKNIEITPSMEKSIQALYDGFLVANSLPALSADELILEPQTNKEQREFLHSFIKLWELVHE